MIRPRSRSSSPRSNTRGRSRFRPGPGASPPLRLWQGASRILLARLVFNGLLQAVVTVAIAWLVRYTFDHHLLSAAPTALPETAQAGAGTGLPLSLGGLAMAFLLTAGVAAWLRLMERADAERLGQDYVHRLRLQLYEHLCRIPPRALQRRSQGGILLRFVGDLGALRQWISLGLSRLVAASIAIGVTLLALAALNAALALVVGGMLALATVASLRLGRPLREAVREARRRRARLTGNISEKLNAMAVVQVCGQARREQHRLERQSRRLREAMILRARLIGWLRAITEGTTVLATAAALVTGVLVVNAGQATPGTVVAAMSLVALLVSPLRDLGRVHEYRQAARVAQQKIDAFLAIPVPRHVLRQGGKGRRTRGDDSRRHGRLVFENVTVEGVLARFSAVVEPDPRRGRVIAVVGPNGAGKSTLLALAAGLLDGDEGQVLLDSQPVARLAPRTLRRRVGMVSPDLPLLRGSIARNLRYRWPKAPAEEIARVSALCGLDALLASLPEGERTRLTDGGRNLSVGQRQRLVMARAILGNPSLLVLDEADANLDPGARKVLQRVIEACRGSVLMATHRLETLRLADEIWHLRDGRLVETGTPEELLRNPESETSRLFHKVRLLAS